MKFESYICDQEMYAEEYGEFMVEDFTITADVVEAHIGPPLIDPDWYANHVCVKKREPVVQIDAFNLHEYATEDEFTVGIYQCDTCSGPIVPQWKLPEPEVAVIWEFYFTALSRDEEMPPLLTLTMEVGGWDGVPNIMNVTFRRVGFVRVSGSAFQNIYASVHQEEQE